MEGICIKPTAVRVVDQYGKTEMVLQRSRFLCFAGHVISVEAAIQFIAKHKKNHPQATHHCYAYVINENQQKSSDDGEPAGTAGRPILETIHQKGLQETVVLIVRYFGGIKLGAGGLIRAYRQGAEKAIEAAGIDDQELHQELILTVPYSIMGKLDHQIRSSNIGFDEPIFRSQILWSIWVPHKHISFWIEQLTDWCQGQLSIAQGQQRLQSVIR